MHLVSYYFFTYLKDGKKEKKKRIDDVFFVFWKFQPIAFALNDIFYYHTKTLIGFWCKQGLNIRSFIQPLKTWPVELIGTYNWWWLLYVKKDKQLKKIIF